MSRRGGLFTSPMCRDEMQIINKGISPYENYDFRPRSSCCISDLCTCALDSPLKIQMHTAVQLEGGNNGAVGIFKIKRLLLFNRIV